MLMYFVYGELPWSVYCVHYESESEDIGKKMLVGRQFEQVMNHKCQNKPEQCWPEMPGTILYNNI